MCDVHSSADLCDNLSEYKKLTLLLAQLDWRPECGNARAVGFIFFFP